MRALPLWLQHYKKQYLSGDIVASFIVTVMLIPQGIAYALLAGLPPQIGLYASILPLIAYALFGSSMTLSVGPVAVSSLMTASALTSLAVVGSEQYIALAAMLALMSGIILILLSVLRFGFLANFLSHPVISGFISGSALLIILSQLKPLLGLQFSAHGTWEIITNIISHIASAPTITLFFGLSALLILWLSKLYALALFSSLSLFKKYAEILSRLVPMAVIMVATLIAYYVQNKDLAVVGSIPQGLPSLHLMIIDASSFQLLIFPALLIGLVGFVESVSVAQSLAIKKQQKIDADKELLGIGAANVASAISGGMPVTGGFARSVVNFNAGANTPLAGLLSAVWVAVILLFFTRAFYFLPNSVLAATIIVAVSGLIDWQKIRSTWQYDKGDFLSLIGTLLMVLVVGVEAGIIAGVVISLVVLVWRSSRPHMAEVGRVPNTEHFRNVQRFSVQTQPSIIALRVDESLFFANTHSVESRVNELCYEKPTVQDFILILSAVNSIDSSALDMLMDLNKTLAQRGIILHFAEIKGPVMDKLKMSALLAQMQGNIFISTHDAFAFCEQKANKIDYII